MEPDDALVDSGHCLANPGVEYVVYQPENRAFTLKVAGAKGGLASEWVNALTGETLKAPTLRNGDCRLAPPSVWTTGPVVLHVGKPPKEKAVSRNTFTRRFPSKSSATAAQ